MHVILYCLLSSFVVLKRLAQLTHPIWTFGIGKHIRLLLIPVIPVTNTAQSNQASSQLSICKLYVAGDALVGKYPATINMMLIICQSENCMGWVNIQYMHINLCLIDGFFFLDWCNAWINGRRNGLIVLSESVDNASLSYRSSRGTSTSKVLNTAQLLWVWSTCLYACVLLIV